MINQLSKYLTIHKKIEILESSISENEAGDFS